MTYYEDRKEFLTCECHMPEHIIVISVSDNSYNNEIYPPDLIFEMQARRWEPFWRRIWTALKYMFGAELVWDETIVTKDDIPKLENAIKHYKKLKSSGKI